MQPNLLTIENLAVKYKDHIVLDDLSLSVQVSEVVGLIGPNGSGKTTLFNAISGFVQPQAGKIILNGVDLTTMAASQRRNLGLARVFQNSGVFKELSVEENMIIAMECAGNLIDPVFTWGSSYKRYRQLAHSALTEVGLAEKMKDKAASLSGGQLRLLEIARTLLMDSRLILLDEPTAGVSPKMKLQVVELIRNLKIKGKTLMIIEHDIELIQSICDRILVLDSGNIALDGTPAAIRTDSRLEEIYFGSAMRGT